MKLKSTQKIIVIISILIVLIWIIKSFKFYLYTGGGLAFNKLLEMGIAEEIAKPKAKALGYLYVFLMYNGYQIPILGLILVSIELLFKTNSRKKRKYLRLAFPLICLWGIIFLNFASHIVLQGDDFLLRFLSALLIWFFITVGFAIVFWLIKSIQHFSKKRITQNTVDKHET